jgi:hypothetical protein
MDMRDDATLSGSGSFGYVFRGRCPLLLSCAPSGRKRTAMRINYGPVIISLAPGHDAGAARVGQHPCESPQGIDIVAGGNAPGTLVPRSVDPEGVNVRKDGPWPRRWYA